MSPLLSRVDLLLYSETFLELLEPADALGIAYATKVALKAVHGESTSAHSERPLK